MEKKLFPFYSIGHFINQPEKPSEFEFLRFETMEEPNVDDFHKHTFYEILWTEKGTSRQIIDYQKYEVKPNSLFFISPNQVHHFEEWKSLNGGTILFTEDFYLLNRNNKDTILELSFLDNLYDNPFVELGKKEFTDITNIIGQIEIEHSRKDENITIIQAYLHILLSQIQRFIDAENPTGRNKKNLIVFKRFKQTLEQHFSENKTASFYANQLNISQHHLNLVCKEITNNTATEIIRARSILEGKRLLTFTNKTIAEIAFELNFTDSSYFAKTFKAFTRQTPAEFKKEMSDYYRTR